MSISEILYELQDSCTRVRNMREIYKKESDSFQEASTINSIQCNQENPKTPKTTEDIEKIDSLQFEKFSNDSDVLLESFQKISVEEQRLLEIKQQMLEKQRDLQNRLVKEIERKKIMIANLTSEIPDLQSRTRQLGEALSVDIYK
jgi:hypothetical protein